MEKETRELLEIEKKDLETIKQKEIIYKSRHEIERYHLSINILEKLIKIQESSLKSSVSLIEAYASVRYILETLIQTELLLKEEKYTFKLFYSIHNHQLDKYEKFIKRIEKEIEIMKSYEKEDQILKAQKIKKLPSKEEQINAIKEYYEAQEKLDSRADLEFTIFTPDYRFNGYGYSAHLMETKILPEYIKRYNEIVSANTASAKRIVKQENIVALFDFRRQFTRVFIELKDDRTWQKKAEETNLSKEYETIYDLTSAIIHSTSYSYHTSNEFTEADRQIALNLIFKYSKKIHKNIKEYINLDLYRNFEVVKLE